MKRLLLAVAVTGSLSCSDSSGPNDRGTLSFTYTGAGGGNYSASGEAPSVGAPPTTSSWAAGFVEAGETHVAASNPRSGGLVDLVLLRLERTTTGSVTIDPSCNIDGFTPCTGMQFMINFNGNGDTADFFCGLTSGTIVLTEIDDDRASGSFSGSGQCFAGSGGAPTAFTVANGAFNVFLIESPL